MAKKDEAKEVAKLKEAPLENETNVLEVTKKKKPAKSTGVKAKASVKKKMKTSVSKIVSEDDDSNTINDSSIPSASKKDNVKKPKKSNGLTDFDWTQFESEMDEYTTEERDKLTKMYEGTLSTVTENEVLDGVVVKISDKDVIVNIGYKSDGLVPLNEFRYNPELKEGDPVELYVQNQEDKNGQLVLSHKMARALRSWERVNSAMENDEIIKGYVKCRTKGGLIVDVFGIEAFLPGSQIDVKPIRDYDIYVDKTMEFKVVKINQEFRNVVVSHKALIEKELAKQKKEIISSLEKGQVIEGIVKNITSYGVFMDLGGVDGLVHITDLSWGRINHPEEIVKLDEKINVVILDFDEEKTKIQLGLKQLSKHPWESLDAKLEIGGKVKGKVVVIADYGIFIEIAPGVEGLIHVSEMSWSNHLKSTQDLFKTGDVLDAIILTLDKEDRKMSLGIKQLVPDPWQDIEKKYPVGSEHKGVVRNYTNFGVFLELEDGIDGLVHISDLSWTKKFRHPSEFTKVGGELEAIVLDLDKENRRLSLGHKQLIDNPWDSYEEIYEVGSIHKGIVQSLTDKGAMVEFSDGAEAFAGAKHLIKENGDKVAEGEKLSFKVVDFSKDGKKILVSHSKIHQAVQSEEKTKEKSKKNQETKSASKSVKKTKEKIEKTTLGDLEALSNLKSKMEKGESKTDLGDEKEEKVDESTIKIEKDDQKNA